MPNANATGYVRVRGYAGDFSVQKSVFEQVVYVQNLPSAPLYHSTSTEMARLTSVSFVPRAQLQNGG